jgi:hypothetical protein
MHASGGWPANYRRVEGRTRIVAALGGGGARAGGGLGPECRREQTRRPGLDEEGCCSVCRASVRVVVPGIGSVKRVWRDHSSIGSFQARFRVSREDVRDVDAGLSGFGDARSRDLCRRPMRTEVGGAVSVGAVDRRFELSENRSGGRPSGDADWRERTVGREHGLGSTMSDLFCGEVGSL